MTRQRLATVLGVLAVVAVLVTAAVALTTYLGEDDAPAGATPRVEGRVVRDPASGASFEVPAAGWVVQDRSVRIFYADDAGRPVAVVRGPAVFRDGYCREQPDDSYRGFAGFTRQRHAAWVRALGSPHSESRSTVTLADGTTARLRWARVRPEQSGPCPAPEVLVATVGAGDVRVVLVADAGAPDTLSEQDAESILTSLRPR